MPTIKVRLMLHKYMVFSSAFGRPDGLMWITYRHSSGRYCRFRLVVWENNSILPPFLCAALRDILAHEGMVFSWQGPLDGDFLLHLEDQPQLALAFFCKLARGLVIKTISELLPEVSV